MSLGLAIYFLVLTVPVQTQQLRGAEALNSTRITVGNATQGLSEALNSTGITIGNDTRPQVNFSVSAENSCSHRGQTIDMIWPGSGYASIACGGIWKALKQCSWNVNMVMCSSGGAASALMVLAGEPRGHGLQVLEKTYKQFNSDGGLLVQARSRQGCSCQSGACPAIDCYWQDIYAQLLRDPASFANFNRKARISLQCRWFGLVVLYNFKTARQASQAVAAAGNGGVASHWIEGLNDYCWDSDASKLSEGIPTKFNSRNLPTYYYNSDSFAFSRTCFGVPWTVTGYQCTDKQVNAGYQDFSSSSLWQRNPSWNGHNYNFGLFTWKDLSA